MQPGSRFDVDACRVFGPSGDVLVGPDQQVATGHVMLAVIGGVLLLATGNVCVWVIRARRAAGRAE